MSWKPISTAPRDGTAVVLRNAQHSPCVVLRRSRDRWVGEALTAMGRVRVYWDVTDGEPTEWCYPNEFRGIIT